MGRLSSIKVQLELEFLLLFFVFILLVYHSEMYYIDKDYKESMKVIPSSMWTLYGHFKSIVNSKENML